MLRPGLFALLVCLLLVFSIQPIPKEISGQTDPVQESRVRLLQAFDSVQQADKLGASSDAIAQLTIELNIALVEYNVASRLSQEGNVSGSEYYARLSNGNSTSIVSKALALQNTAESQIANVKLTAYLVAIVASILSSLIVLEYPRILNLLRKRKLARTPIRIGD